MTWKLFDLHLKFFPLFPESLIPRFTILSKNMTWKWMIYCRAAKRGNVWQRAMVKLKPAGTCGCHAPTCGTVRQFQN